MSNFLDQFNENVRNHNRRLPQRLLKVAVIIGAVIVVAPLTSVVGNAFGPAAAMVVAITGLFATLAVWWLAHMILFPAPALAPIPPTMPGQPQTPFAQAQPPIPSRGGRGFALVAAAGVLMFSCCGGGVVVVAALGSLMVQHRDAAARPDAAADPFGDLHAGHRQMEDAIRRQEQQLRDLERGMQRDPFRK
jgi:hypothetical protein